MSNVSGQLMCFRSPSCARQLLSIFSRDVVTLSIWSESRERHVFSDMALMCTSAVHRSPYVAFMRLWPAAVHDALRTAVKQQFQIKVFVSFSLLEYFSEWIKQHSHVVRPPPSMCPRCNSSAFTVSTSLVFLFFVFFFCHWNLLEN